MPIIPRVSLNPLPGARVNPNAPIEAFGGGAAAQTVDLSGVANVAAGEAQKNALERARLRQEAADEADQVATTHAYSATKTGTNDILHGPDGLLNRRGKDAFTIDQDAYDRYGKLVGDIREQLGTDRQRAIYDKMVLNEWNQVDSQIQPHIAAQRRVFDKEGTEAGIDANNTRAMATYSDPAIVDDAIAHNQALAAGYLQRQGAPDEAIANKRAEIESSMRLDVLKQYVDNGQDLSATAYFDKYKDKFVGDTLLKAETLTRRGTVEGEGQRQADAIVKTATDETQAFEQAAQITEPQVRKAAEQQIALHYNRQAAAKRVSQDAAFQSGYQTLRDHGWDLSKVPLSVRNQMGAMHEENLVRASEHQQKAAVSGPPGDPEQFQTMLNEAYLNPEQFASRNILEVDGLSTRQIDRLQTLQRTVGARVQRTDEASIVAGMKATTAAGVPPTDPNVAALGTDTGLADAMRSGTPPKAPPPAMLQDVTRSGGGGSKYADLLRASGFAIPRNWPSLEQQAAEQKALEAEKKVKPPTTKTVVNRDASGRITDTQTTVIKPE